MAQLNLLTDQGDYTVHSVESLGNQKAVIDGNAVYVANTGNPGLNAGIALAALGASLDLGMLAWPDLEDSWNAL